MAAAPVDPVDEADELEEPEECEELEVLLLDLDEVAVEKPDEEPETADELPVATAGVEVAEDSGTTGAERPAGIDAAAV